MLSWPVFWLGGTFGVMILSLCVVAGDADRQSEEVRFAFLAIAGLWGLSALLGAGMRLSSCEERSRGLLRRRSVSRLQVGGCFQGQGVARAKNIMA
jgi:heme A synthase